MKKKINYFLFENILFFALFSIIILFPFKLAWVDIKTPIPSYFGDANYIYLLVNNIAETGFHYYNPKLGHPFESQLFQFPIFDNLLFSFFRFFYFFTKNEIVSINLIIIFVFYLNAIFMFFISRKLNIDLFVSIILGITFALLPFQLTRMHNGHMVLIFTFLEPVFFYILLKIVFDPNSIKKRFILVSSFFFSLTNVYYVFFKIFFSLLSLCYCFVQNKKLELKKNLVLTGSIILFFLVVNIDLLYKNKLDPNPNITNRAAWEQPLNALKISDLIVPLNEKIKSQKILKYNDYYNRNRTYGPNYHGGSGRDSYLGSFYTIIGFFLCSMYFFIFRLNEREYLKKFYDEKLNFLSLILVLSLLFFLPFSFGYIFNLIVTASIRDQARVFIEIFIISSFFFGLLFNKIKNLRLIKYSFSFFAIVFVFLLLFQSKRDFKEPVTFPENSHEFKRFQNIKANIIEKNFSKGSKFLFLPFTHMPEGSHVAGMSPYEQITYFLHYDEYIWSTGIFRGHKYQTILDETFGEQKQIPINKLNRCFIENADYDGVFIVKFGLKNKNIYNKLYQGDGSNFVKIYEDELRIILKKVFNYDCSERIQKPFWIMEKNIFTVFYRNFDPFGKIDDGEGNLGWDNAEIKIFSHKKGNVISSFDVRWANNKVFLLFEDRKIILKEGKNNLNLKLREGKNVLKFKVKKDFFKLFKERTHNFTVENIKFN